MNHMTHMIRRSDADEFFVRFHKGLMMHGGELPTRRGVSFLNRTGRWVWLQTATSEHVGMEELYQHIGMYSDTQLFGSAIVDALRDLSFHKFPGQPSVCGVLVDRDALRQETFDRVASKFTLSFKDVDTVLGVCMRNPPTRREGKHTPAEFFGVVNRSGGRGEEVLRRTYGILMKN